MIFVFLFLDERDKKQKKEGNAKETCLTENGPKRKRRNRSHFTQRQLQYLEKIFSRQQYLTRDERALLARGLEMTELQIRNWFQNQRYQRKHRANENRKADEKPDSSTCVKSEAWKVLFSCNKNTYVDECVVCKYCLRFSSWIKWCIQYSASTNKGCFTLNNTKTKDRLVFINEEISNSFNVWNLYGSFGTTIHSYEKDNKRLFIRNTATEELPLLMKHTNSVRKEKLYEQRISIVAQRCGWKELIYYWNHILQMLSLSAFTDKKGGRI